MSTRPCVIIVSVFVLLVSLPPAKAARSLKTDRHTPVHPFTPGSIRYSEEAIKNAGYGTDTIDDILKACKADSFYIRNCSVVVLTDRIGDQAIPVLKKALDDRELRVRIEAASLLRLMGDRSGLAQMQKDYAAVVPDGGLTDPNLAGLSGAELERAKQKIRKRNFTAMKVARVLAEFEDHTGFELAAKLALDNREEWVYGLRIDAARVLVEIAMDDPKLLKAENRDPEPILVAIADSEKDTRVLQRLAGDIYGCRLRNDMTIHVLEKIVASPHLVEKDRRQATTYLNGVRERAVGESRAKSQPANDPNQVP